MLMKAMEMNIRTADHYVIRKNLLVASYWKLGLVFINAHRYPTYLNKTLDCPRYLFEGARPRKPAKHAKN